MNSAAKKAQATPKNPQQNVGTAVLIQGQSLKSHREDTLMKISFQGVILSLEGPDPTPMGFPVILYNKNLMC